MSASIFVNCTPPRAARRRLAKLQAAVDRVTDADRRYFDRRPDRTYRVRLAAPCEIETAALALDVDAAPVPGGRHVMLVRKLALDVRFRVMAQARDWIAADLDSVGDEEVGRAYRHTCRPGTAAFRAEAEALAALRTAGLVP